MRQESYIKMHQYENSHWWFSGRRAIIKKILDFYFHDSKTSRKILEIGCGSGGNLELLSKYGNLYAVELDKNAAEIANNKGLARVMCGYLPDNIPFVEKFDLICMLDVLEHIDDDLEALKITKNLLYPKSKLLITVPAYKFLWSNHDVATDHKRRYTRREIIRLAHNAGFNLLYSTYFNTFLFPLISIIRLLNNLKRNNMKNASNDLDMPSSTINLILKFIFSSERYFLPKLPFPFGVSILLLVET